MIKSFFFLLGLYYFRHVPQSIFWGLFSVLPTINSLKLKTFYLGLLLSVSYVVSFFLLCSLMIFAFNVLLAYDFQSTILPILLTEDIITNSNIKTFSRKNFSLLLSPLINLKRFALPFQFILRLLEFIALISIGIGLVDILNDVTSHVNPDLFDVLFPLNGALPFYGGITILSVTSFFLYFIIPPRNIQIWMKKVEISSHFPAVIRNQAISPSLLFPYFFLTPKGRFITGKNGLSAITLALLLKKALLDNKDQIPEEWLEN